MTDERRLHLFERVGVEIEYMIVDQETLDVRPIADKLFHDVLGTYGSDVEGETVTWSNELVAHVLELKTTLPVENVELAGRSFVPELSRILSLLQKRDAVLMPTAMHPWMNPKTETTLWPHEGCEVYENFDRVFGCQGHGWSNLQSMHLNLPFANDEEFGRLHAAIRLVLPLIPALAASSPFEEGITTGWLDNRLKHYRTNSKRIPQVAGEVIPEPVRSQEEYHDKIFKPMFEAIAPFDPEEEMQEEWLNARGAIARFERGSIEIRVIDSQESPVADSIVGSAVVALARSLVQEEWSSYEDQFSLDQSSLVELFENACRRGEEAVALDSRYLRMFDIVSAAMKAGDLWRAIARRLPVEIGEPLLTQVDRKPLARRLLLNAHEKPSKTQLLTIYRQLVDCLAENRFFDPNRG
jgi:glutamate---cysteine ligase / carboxylate-amine ligase